MLEDDTNTFNPFVSKEKKDIFVIFCSKLTQNLKTKLAKQLLCNF